MAEQGKKFNQLIKISTINDAATFIVDNGSTEINTISFNDFKNNKLIPLFPTKTEMNTLVEEQTTIKNDLGDLGDQVSNIETKIPESASSTNQLVTKEQIDNGNYISSQSVVKIINMSQEEYDALENKEANVLYIII